MTAPELLRSSIVKLFAATLALALVVGCHDPPSEIDGGAPDAGPVNTDAGGRDGGADGGVDAGAVDAGPLTFEGTAVPLPDTVRARMTDVSWRAGCPVGLDALAYLEVTHWGFDGAVHEGEMVVAADVADDVLGVFRAMFDARFPIERMQLVDDYDADDDRSMEANNTSAFNCRQVTGGSSFSQHSYGDAIDINPIQNPYVRGGTVLPPAGDEFTDRADVRPGMIVSGDVVTGAFDSLGWGWGGGWMTLKDYQHFSRNGR